MEIILLLLVLVALIVLIVIQLFPLKKGNQSFATHEDMEALNNNICHVSAQIDTLISASNGNGHKPAEAISATIPLDEKQEIDALEFAISQNMRQSVAVAEPEAKTESQQPKKERTEKQKANDERLRQLAKAKHEGQPQ